MRSSPDVPPPPALFGRPRQDRFLRFLTAFADRYLALATRTDPTGRHPATSRPPLRLTVTDRRMAAEDVVALRLAAADGAPLPPWRPGAHLDLRLPSGRTRQYSLCGDPAERHSYRIAVRRLPGGGGGSAEVHDTLTPGARVTVAGPRNAFPFAAQDRVLLLAGGIGITPILPMAREAARRGLDWRLVHCGRTRASLPFADELAALDARHPGRVRVRADDEHGPPDAARLLADAPPGAAVYCCGPGPLLDAVRAAFDAGPAGALHAERFAAPPVVDGRPFSLRLRRSGTLLPVPADRTALDVLRESDPATASSCRQGFCGVCRVRVLAGPVEHRDRRLTPAQRAAGDMLVCVSRAPEGACLELDL
ncbi:PDR/VanB family oxidoreductase [Streptomyces chumphonensis]|uniref:PDR/VanB family oxidoreductase n=1 Tax=Streptomyces chumphonensis TaxID=1214925 RepID=UPI003D765849